MCLDYDVDQLNQAPAPFRMSVTTADMAYPASVLWSEQIVDEFLLLSSGWYVFGRPC
ncbi:hypothetical protein N9B17_01105 [Rhodopirellula sp.]|nr:hypothetical protein [Rhodopirellula sp.]